jgi:hypothetical protein
MHTKSQSESLKGRNHTKDIEVDGKIIFEWMLGKQAGKVWTGCIWIRIRTGGGSCEHGNGLSGSMKGDEFLD